MLGKVFFLILLSGLVSVIVFSRWCFENALPMEKNASTSGDRLPEPFVLKLCALGFEQTLADFYWLGFIQYLGDKQNGARYGYSQSEKFIRIIIELDPHFLKVYYFAAFIIGSELHQPEIAAQIIQHGIEENPNSWYLPFIAGINQYLYAHNEIRAAKYYRMAAKFPDAPKWLERQARILEAKIPSTIKEVNVWDSIYASSTDAGVKEKARVRLVGLWLRVYRSSPSREIKKRALEQLQKFGASL
jgi:hypothetical protein